MQVNLPVLLINIPHTIGFQPIAPPSTEQPVYVVLLSLLDECAGAAPHALTGLRPVCGRVARRQNFYLEPSIVTAVGGFFYFAVLVHHLEPCSTVLARSSTRVHSLAVQFAKHDLLAR